MLVVSPGQQEQFWMHQLVEDNGKGFSLNEKRTGFGITGMQQRVAALERYFHLETEPGSGCKITVELPLRSSGAGDSLCSFWIYSTRAHLGLSSVSKLFFGRKKD